MKILIIENEIYLAQSIATKLGEIGHICEMCTSTKDAIRGHNYDSIAKIDFFSSTVRQEALVKNLDE